MKKGSKELRAFYEEVKAGDTIEPPRVLTQHAKERIKERKLSLSAVVYGTDPNVRVIRGEDGVVITAYAKPAFRVEKPKLAKPRRPKPLATGKPMSEVAPSNINVKAATPKTKPKQRSNANAQPAANQTRKLAQGTSKTTPPGKRG